MSPAKGWRLQCGVDSNGYVRLRRPGVRATLTLVVGFVFALLDAFSAHAGAAVHEDYTKILVGPDGAVAQVFPAAVEPLDSALLQAIEAGLAPAP